MMFVRVTDTYEKAYSKLTLAQETSDLQSDREHEDQTRLRKKRFVLRFDLHL
jgi:hypothetical protein